MPSLRSDALRTTVSNLAAVGITGLLTVGLPRFLTGEEYGEWQMYQFFCLYLGYITFGASDGLLVRTAAASMDRLSSMLIGSQRMIYGGLLAISLTLGILLFAALSSNGNLTVAFSLAAVATWFFCLRTFVSTIWQAQRLTAPFAFVVTIERLLSALVVVVLITVGVRSVVPLLLADIAGKFVAFLWCVVRAQGIPYLVGRPMVGWQEFLASCRIGAPLLISNLAAASIYGILRLFVQAGWGLEVFGRVSLSLTLANMALVVINSIAVVLVPVLQTSRDLAQTLRQVSRSLTLPVIVSLLGYFLVEPIASWIIPNSRVTSESLAVLFPLCVFEVRMRVIGGSFLRVANRGSILMWTSVGTIAVGLVIFTAATKNHELRGLLLSFVGLLAVRAVVIDVLTTRTLGARLQPYVFLEVMAVAFFLVCSLQMPNPLGCICYLAATVCVAIWIRPNFARRVEQN